LNRWKTYPGQSPRQPPDGAVAGGPRGYARRVTYEPSHSQPSALLQRKRDRGLSVTVCLPARNEEATVGTICQTIRNELVEVGLVDQLLVMDSRSTDATAAAARSAGAEVHAVSEILPGLPAGDGGKGEALWKSLVVARGDIVVWMDADTRNFSAEFVVRLLEPMLGKKEVVLAKAFYERPITVGEELKQSGGARVTELVARPLINLFMPELAGMVQPLSGEYAVLKSAARSVPFLSGYAPDIGLLIWIAEEYGLEKIAQVDLGTRVHRNQDIRALGRMSHQVMQGMFHAFNEFGRLKLLDELPTTLTQFEAEGGALSSEDFELRVVELPRMTSLLH
jgi:glucosyl-3-phosphoglycerate synthase